MVVVTYCRATLTKVAYTIANHQKKEISNKVTVGTNHFAEQQ